MQWFRQKINAAFAEDERLEHGYFEAITEEQPAIAVAGQVSRAIAPTAGVSNRPLPSQSIHGISKPITQFRRRSLKRPHPLTGSIAKGDAPAPVTMAIFKPHTLDINS